MRPQGRSCEGCGKLRGVTFHALQEADGSMRSCQAHPACFKRIRARVEAARVAAAAQASVMAWVYDDGGRAKAGFKGKAGDCVVRAIAIASGQPYLAVYDALNALEAAQPRRSRTRGSARTGINKDIIRRYLEGLGWRFTPTMQIGSGCRVHLAPGELPGGTLIVSVSRHLTAVVDGVIRDTHDPQREGQTWYRSSRDAAGSLVNEVVSQGGGRCVYGYWQKGGGK